MNGNNDFDYQVSKVILYAGDFGTQKEQLRVLNNADVTILRKALSKIVESNNIFYKKSYAISQITRAIENKSPYPIERNAQEKV